MVKKSKTSSSAQPTTAPLVTVVGSELDVVANSNYLAYLTPNVAAARLVGQQSSDDLNNGEEDPEEDPDDGPEGPDGPDGPEEGNNLKPSLSDIQVVSNEIVYDAANNPTAKVVFKVRNSSGEALKAINVKVERK
jgi:hypothetical protein